jgi:N-acetylmuramoyl-L-alanine amidase
MKSILIDAGHGGKDPGAVYKKRVEKVFNLDNALTLGGMLSKIDPNISVKYTRTDDTFVPLSTRVSIANKSDAIFVSLHCNSCYTAGSASGFEVCFSDKRKLGFPIAQKLVEQVAPIFPLHGTGILPRPDLYVLKLISKPAVLLEMFFLNNEKDVELFQQVKGELFRVIAETIYSFC